MINYIHLIGFSAHSDLAKDKGFFSWMLCIIVSSNVVDLTTM